MKIVTAWVSNWKMATKTQPIKARPLSTLLIDRSVTAKFLVATLEGNEDLRSYSIICIGAAGDAWQQTAKKLLDKYIVTDIDADGWMICTPKPDNEVNCFELSHENMTQLSANNPNALVEYPNDRMYNLGDYAIEGQWGDNHYPELGKAIQWASRGDFLCQNRKDPTDVWIVRKKLFLNTYVLKS